MVTVNTDYIFNTTATGLDDEIIEDHYDNGRLSDRVWDQYDYWSSLNGVEVTVISVQAVKKIGSCEEWAKVFIKSEGFNWWFSAHVNELSPIKNNNPTTGKCKCDLGLIMIRGCQCGGN